MIIRTRAVWLAALATALTSGLPVHAGQPVIISRAPPPAASPAPAAPSPSVDRIARAQANYEALRRGDIAIGDLAPQDLQDIVDLDRALRNGQADTRTPAQVCVDDELRRAGGRPSRLAWRIIELKCREIGGGLSR
ncbi:hypothetical protein [Porphyrobacter sp. AAP60]|uniref:hypothetical protein n=1 Tax=Porphyrobacter sp. AAP60 TaxID=1523423 RepID=UPI000B196B3B|nr:hypothetical protein [Porphyrobacter sp. AAP60]